MLTGHHHAVASSGHRPFVYHDLGGLNDLNDESSTVVLDGVCLLSATGFPGDSTDELLGLLFGHRLPIHPYSLLVETLSPLACIFEQSPPSLAVTSHGPGLRPKRYPAAWLLWRWVESHAPQRDRTDT